MTENEIAKIPTYLKHCSIVPLFHCSIVLLFYCSIVFVPTANCQVFNEDSLLYAIFNTLKDSGSYDENNLKNGYWTKYSVDTSMKNQETLLSIGDYQTKIKLGSVLVKEQGNYIKGKRDGLWKHFENQGKQQPIDWILSKETNYKNGVKDGWEKIYSLYPDLVAMETHYTAGKEDTFRNYYYNGTLKIEAYIINRIYYISQENYPPEQGGGTKLKLIELLDEKGNKVKKLHKYDENGLLIQEGTIVNGKYKGEFRWFYKTGRVITIGFFNDTIPYGKWKEFYENGSLKAEYTFKNGLLQGTYKAYHQNGQLWTERRYKKGKLWDVISNYDSKGKPQDKGTLKNGTGTVIIYDENGHKVEELYYKDGIISKQ